MRKTRYTIVTSLAATFLAVIAVAWACTAAYHRMSIVSTIYYPTGPTSVLIAEGYCSADPSAPVPCKKLSDMNLYQD